MITARATLVMALTLSTVAMAGGEPEDMKPYPAAEAGFQRMVFRVPSTANDADRKVEVIVGKTLSVDCNRTWFGGDLQRRVAKGWGFPYFVLESAGGPASTMMACPPGEPKTDAFVPVRGEGFLQRYNSKLPMVIYVPDGFDVRYRIWAAGEDVGHASPE